MSITLEIQCYTHIASVFVVDIGCGNGMSVVNCGEKPVIPACEWVIQADAILDNGHSLTHILTNCFGVMPSWFNTQMHGQTTHTD